MSGDELEVPNVVHNAKVSLSGVQHNGDNKYLYLKDNIGILQWEDDYPQVNLELPHKDEYYFMLMSKVSYKDLKKMSTERLKELFEETIINEV